MNHLKKMNSMPLGFRYLVCALVLVLLLPILLFAQSDTARIVGTVTDATGALVPGATVTAINLKTNIRTEVTSADDGSFVITPLRVGTYNLEATKQGFRKFVKPNIMLDVNDVVRIDVQLAVGDVAETVTVTAGAPLIESETSSLSQVISDRRIVDLPLNGRNFTQLALLVPGVTRGTLGANADGSQGNAETFRLGEVGSAAVSVNGLREQNNNFQLDGIDNNESIVNTLVFFPPVEAMAEFRVITNVAPAEFGRGGGAIVNAVIKSGTNDFHGSAFEFMRNSALDARPTFANTKPVFIRHQFGGTIGGPIRKDKTFFFADYQGLRQRLPVEPGGRVTVPTARMRRGDFSELLNANFTGLGRPVTIYNPNTGVPFPGNIINIPLSTVGANYLNVYPMPDLLDRAQQNYYTRRVRKQTFDDFDARIDHRFTDKDSVFGRFSFAQDRQYDPGRIPGYQAGFGSGKNQVNARSLALNYTRTFSPALINEARFGYIKQLIQWTPVGYGTDQNQALGIPGVAGRTAANGISLIGGGNGSYIEYLGDFGEYTLDERSLQFSDALTWVKGKHTMKFGATVIQRHIKSVQADFNKGFYFFDDFTATPGNVPAAGRTGYEVADMLIGRTAFTTTSVPGINPATTVSWENGFYAQDDWRVHRRLTINMGLRYDVLTPYYEADNHLSNWDPVAQRLVLAGQGGASRSTVDTDRRNFGPRIGLAYSLTSDGRTVLRGGYGLFYTLDRGGIGNQLTQNPPFITTQFRFAFGAVNPNDIASGAQVRLSDRIPLPDTVNPSSPDLPLGSALRYRPRETKNTRVQQFNLTVERELTSKLALNVAYVGTRGANVTAVTSVAGFGGAVLGRLTTIANIGESRYDSLQIKMNLNPWHGLSFLTGYTYGKATNNSPGPFPGISSAYRTTPTDAGGVAPGLADYDVNHRFTFAGIYEIPVYSGATGAARKVMEGWQLNAIVSLQKGTPFSVFDGCGRARLVGDPEAGGGTANRWFNTAAFAQCSSPTEQSGRNILRGPGIANVDFSLFRKFKITERTGIDFRAEFFNLFNHPQFSFPEQFLGSGNFGRITTTRLNSERQIQFGLRWTF